jgi:hypothetical protein
MQVTEEDGGRLNAFAKEPRMVVVEKQERGGGNRLLLIGGLVLVLALVAVAGRVLFDEPLTAPMLAGIALIIGGVLTIEFSGSVR